MEFNSSKNCIDYFLFRHNITVEAQLNVIIEDNNKFVNFTISSVSIDFNNVIMTVQALPEDRGHQQAYQHFFIYTRGLSCDAPLNITCKCTFISLFFKILLMKLRTFQTLQIVLTLLYAGSLHNPRNCPSATTLIS